MANAEKTYKNTRTGDVHTTSDADAQKRLESYPEVWELVSEGAKPVAKSAKKAAARKPSKKTAPAKPDETETETETEAGDGDGDGDGSGDDDADGEPADGEPAEGDEQ